MEPEISKQRGAVDALAAAQRFYLCRALDALAHRIAQPDRVVPQGEIRDLVAGFPHDTYLLLIRRALRAPFCSPAYDKMQPRRLFVKS